MTRTQQKRLAWISLIVGGIAVAVALVLFALRQNIQLYYTPSQIQLGEAPIGKVIRVGGLVVKGSLHRNPETLQLQFRVTDLSKETLVVYQGILPDLFREGKGVIATGQLTTQGFMQAQEILAKHDENYMPPEVAASLKKRPVL